MVERWMVALGIFAATYVLISVARLPHIPLQRPYAALLGGAMMVVLGVVPPLTALQAIDGGVLALLLGMMMLAAALEWCGFFGWCAQRLRARAVSGVQLLRSVIVLTALSSALILNDTVVLLMTPIVIRLCMQAKLPPMPYLIGMALAANIGSVATPMGNPQNAYVASASGIPLVTFVALLLPLAVGSLLIALLILPRLFARDLPAVLPEVGATAIEPLRDVGLLRLTLATIAAVVVGMALLPLLAPSLPLGVVALLGGTLVLLCACGWGRAVPTAMVRLIDWEVLLLFVGLFVLLAGVTQAGLHRPMLAALGVPLESRPSPAVLVLASAVLANLLSNVPSTLLLAPIARAGGAGSWLTLAGASTLAGNATMIGAAANLIVAQKASRAGVELSWRTFTVVGLAVTIPTLLFCALYASVLLG